jgi:hypothetical protein
MVNRAQFGNLADVLALVDVLAHHHADEFRMRRVEVETGADQFAQRLLRRQRAIHLQPALNLAEAQ